VAFSASVKMTEVEGGDSRWGCVHATSSPICSLSAKSALDEKSDGVNVDVDGDGNDQG
jgi:hypothetical protein